MAKITEKGFKKIEYTDIADIPKAVNDNIDNAESIIDDLGKPTFSESETADNISSGETLGVLFSKIKKAITNLISHIANGGNPHNVTAEQVGLGSVPNVTTNNQKPTFTEATNRSNIVSGETISVLFGKIKKFFADLKTVAFTGSYTDLSNKPTTATTSASGFMSAADKTKLNGIATGANNYTHPSTHAASMIVQDSSHRFVSDNEISDWDSKLGAQDEIYDGWTLCEVAESVSDFSGAFNTNSFAGAGEIVEKLTDAMRSATIVVGASNSKYHSDYIHAVDYECTGTNDQTKIQQAIDALPSTGGRIVLLDGTYNISGQINVNKPNVTICGMGNSTVLQRKFNGNNVIYVTSANCELAYFKVDGDSATYTNTANCNIQMYGAGYQNIHDITTVNATDCGIKIRNVCHYSNIYNISADGNKIGILFDGTTGAKICKNTVTNSTATGILLSWNTRDCVVAENIVDTATTYGICIENTNSCVRNVVANNVVRKCATNIYVNNSYNIVACNMVEPETGQKTIHVGSSGKYNHIVDNYIYSINYTNDGGTTNTFANNKY